MRSAGHKLEDHICTYTKVRKNIDYANFRAPNKPSLYISKTFSYKYILPLIRYYPQIIPHLGHDIFYINPTFVGLHHQDHEIGALIDHDFRKSCATTLCFHNLPLLVGTQ